MEVFRSDEHYSKTFVFEKTVLSVSFITEIDLHNYSRAWIENTVRVSVMGRDVNIVEEIARKHNASDAMGDQGKWKNSLL